MTSLRTLAEKPSKRRSVAHTYRVSNADVQSLLIQLLSRFHDLRVRAVDGNPRPSIVVECRDALRADAVHDIILTTDWGAKFVEPATRADNVLIA